MIQGLSFCLNESPIKISPLNFFLPKERKYLDGGTLERIEFPTKYGTQDHKTMMRYGFLVKQPDAPATILICHGFMCDKVDIGFLRMALFSSYNVVIFDFRAHGQGVEQDQCCTFGRDEAYDVMGAVNYIRSRHDLKDLPLIGYGFSMGAVAAIQAQSTYEKTKNEKSPEKFFDAMILDCPYDSSENVIKQGLNKLKINFCGYTFDIPGKSFLEKYAFNPYVQTLLKSALKTIAQMDATATNTYIHVVNPVYSIRNVSVPCFFIHCRHDEKVSVDAAYRIYQNASCYKRLWITEGRRHFDSFFYYPEKYKYKVNCFIEHVINDDLSPVSAKIIYDVEL